jgi:hypothetical protein
MTYSSNIFQKLFYFFSLLILIVSVDACTDKDKRDQANVPSQGNIGEIMVIIDSTYWRGPIGDTLRSIFSAEVPGLSSGEPYFRLTYIHPDIFNNFIKKHKNLIFVTSLEDDSPTGQRMKQYFSDQAVESINKDSSLFMFAKQNEFARDQEILHLFGKTDEQLLANLSKNKERIREHFSAIERRRLQRTLYTDGEEKDLESKIAKDHGFKLRIPQGFALAKSDSNFVWITKPGKELMMHIFVAYKPYESTDAFKPENIIAWRDSIGYNYMYNRKIENSYMATQTYIPPSFKQVAFNKKFAIEARGLWKLQNNSRGGPFISYVFVDEATNRLYYIEGFILGPGVERKREFIRQLESILWTFEPVQNGENAGEVAS